MSQLQVTGEAKIRDIQGPVVANSGVITALDGAASQYVRGDGTLADFPTSTGGGSSVSYYLNSSVSQGTIGGVAYRELSKEPIIGAGTDITISANGYVASYITDANDPDVLSVPGGNFNCEFYFSVNNNTGNPTTYAELYKYDGTTFTLLGSSQAVPESLNQGTTIAPYYFAIPVATAALALTDRLAIRIYVSVDGRTVTLHTENGHLCQVVTTLSKGMVSLNNLTDQSQFITTGTSGTDFNIVSSGDTHTFNIPSASASNRGLITTGSQTIAGAKTFQNNLNINGQLFVFGATGYGGGVSYRQGNILATSDGSTTLEFPDANSIKYYVGQGSNTYKNFIFDVANITTGATRTYNLPDLSGTLALTSDLSSYVPYTGATGDVDLGVHSLTAFGVTANSFYAQGNGTQGGYLYLKQGTIPYGTLAGSNSISADGTKYIYLSDAGSNNSKTAIFQLGSITNNTERTYTLPDITGTLALLEGTQTFTGAKTFSSSVSINTGGQASLSILSTSGNSALILGYVNSVLRGTIDISATEFKLISAIDNILKFQSSTNFKASLIFSNSADYSYTFPNATGTLALTSNLSAYLPLTGGTLTGALSGTSATFVVNQNSTITNSFQNTNTASTSSRNILNITAGNATLQLQAIHGDNVYISPTTAIDTYLGYNNSLRLASTGAATFSSSVTAGGDITINKNNSTDAVLKVQQSTNFYASAINLVAANDGGAVYNYISSGTNGATPMWQIGGGASSNTMVMYTAGTERMRITASGNVGIGTSSPSTKLHITGNTSNAVAVQFNGGYSEQGGLGGDNSVVWLGAGGASFTNNGLFVSGSSSLLYFNTNGVERMRITSDARVLIGKTTINIDAADGFRFDENGAMFASISSGNETYYVRDITNSVYRFYVTSGGTINATNTTISAISDVRLKENITDLEIGLDAIMALRPRKFDWKKESGNDGKNVRGFIAQEFEQVFPDLIDESLNKSPEGEAYKQIRQDLIPILVKAIQEQQAQIEELKAMIAAK